MHPLNFREAPFFRPRQRLVESVGMRWGLKVSGMTSEPRQEDEPDLIRIVADASGAGEMVPIAGGAAV